MTVLNNRHQKYICLYCLLKTTDTNSRTSAPVLKFLGGARTAVSIFSVFEGDVSVSWAS
jgi:hypothetical protein